MLTPPSWRNFEGLGVKPESKVAFQQDKAAVLVGNSFALKELFAFEGISLPTHGAIEKFTFLPVRSNTSSTKIWAKPTKCNAMHDSVLGA